MRKYMLAFLITIPILLLVWNISDSSEEPLNTYNVPFGESTSNQIGILQETDGIVSEEIGGSRTDSQSSVNDYGIESTAEMTIEIINAVLLTQNIKEHLQNNDLSGFTFQESEKALCYYMGTAHNYPDMYVFAVCKEALNGDIVDEKDIYIAKETGHLYAKDNGTLVELNADMPKGIQLPDITRNSAWNREPELVYGEDGTSFQIACDEDGEKVLDQMLDFAKKEEVPGDWGVIYYGECTYFYRRYHEVHLVEEHDTHVLTLKRYYIDALNGNVYEEPYERFIGGYSEIVLHFVGNIEIRDREITEADQEQWKVYIQPDIPEPFIAVLKQYEDFMNTDIRILNDDAWWYEFNIVDGERGDLLWELCGSLMSLLKDSVEESDIEEYRYSLTDLTGDGFPELIMGRYNDLLDETWLYVVYYHSETEGIKMEWHSSYFFMTLYEGGIIEYISAGVNYTMTYYRFQEATESWEQADCILVEWDSQSDSENYYWGVKTANFSDPDNKPMSEEEYREIMERYTTKPVELEWIPMFAIETP